MMTARNAPAIVRNAPLKRAGIALPPVVDTTLALLMVMLSVVMTAAMVALAAILMPAALAVTMLVEAVRPSRGRRARPGWRPVPVRA